jgi:hypothetical protein
MARGGWTLLRLLGLLALTACSTLPEYAAPRGKLLDPAVVDTADAISYRILTRADFKSAKPPPEFASVADKVGAATCAHILTAPDTTVLYQPFRAPDGGTLYRARFQNLRFFAQMDRSCSWWNPRQRAVPAEYILEHEQIHFAIFELESRRLNGSSSEIKALLEATASTPDAAVQRVQQQLEAHLEGRMQDILKRSREFDEDTSLGHNPEEQTRWWNLVSSELAAP